MRALLSYFTLVALSSAACLAWSLLAQSHETLFELGIPLFGLPLMVGASMSVGWGGAGGIFSIVSYFSLLFLPWLIHLQSREPVWRRRQIRAIAIHLLAGSAASLLLFDSPFLLLFALSLVVAWRSETTVSPRNPPAST